VETWREGYPYDVRMSRQEYEQTKRTLQIELLKLQSWIKETSGTSSVMPRTYRPLARSCCSIGLGTTERASNASWASAPTPSTKEAMFFYTDTADVPWTVVKSNDKKRGRIGALRHVLSRLDYDGKDLDIVAVPDPRIIGPAADVYETDEHGRRPFPRL
jgi:hypothetical protein